MEALERRKAGSKQVPCIATHCVAGLGRFVARLDWYGQGTKYGKFTKHPFFFSLYLNRAPVLVAIALIEDGMSPLDSVELIRERRRGAINSKQLRYLESYKREQEAGSCRIC